MKSDKQILEQFETHYNITKSGLKNQYKHIQECQAYYSGDYMNYKDDYAFGRGSSRRIKQVQFNRVKPYVNSVVGFIAQQRRKPDYQARLEEKQEQSAFTDYLNGMSDYVRDNSNADQTETKQDMDLVIGGVGVTDTCITLNGGEASRDPNGEVIIERVEPEFCGWDPKAVHPNILDSKWCWRSKDWDLDEAMDLLDASEEGFEIANDETTNNLEFNPYGGIQDKIGFEWADPQRLMVRVYFYQWVEIESYFRIENPLKEIADRAFMEDVAFALTQIEVDDEEELFKFDPAAHNLVITKKTKKAVREVFEQFDIEFNPITEKRKVYYTSILSGKKVFDSFKSVSQQGFSLKFKTGDRDEVNHMWTGLVASMRDPQRYYNKSLTELMLIIANNSRGGVMIEEDAVDNIQEFEAKWALTNSVVRVNSGALSGGKILPKAVPQMNTGYEGILEVSGSALSQVTGIDESFFGAISGGNETAMLQRQRIKQATTTLALYFDSIALYAKEQARMMLSFMRLLAESSEGRLFPMADGEGNSVHERFSPDFFADEYDIKIGESPDTPMQKEYYTQTLLGMAQSFQSIGDPRAGQLYAAAVKYMPIPNRDKTVIIENLIGQQQIDPKMVEQLQAKIQEMEGQQAQLMNANLQANIDKTQADTQDKLVSAQKTAAEIAGVHEDNENKALENDLIEEEKYTKATVSI